MHTMTSTRPEERHHLCAIAAENKMLCVDSVILADRSTFETCGHLRTELDSCPHRMSNPSHGPVG